MKILGSCLLILLMADFSHDCVKGGNDAPLPAIAGRTTCSQFTPLSVWLDTDGNFIQAHGGGILYDDSAKTYYWYGEDRGSRGSSWAIGISCYSSQDLYNWKRDGIVLPASGTRGSVSSPTPVLERPKVIYNNTTNKYVMWMHIDDTDYSFARTGVAVSDAPTGPFDYLGSERPNNEMSRDMTLFKDDDGRAYLIYSSENNATMCVSLLTDDYLHQSGTYARVFIDGYREAPAMFKHNKQYYLITSACTGWAPNAAEYAVASSPLGPWTVKGNPCTGPDSSTTFGAQSTWVLKIAGKPGEFIFMADCWNPRHLADSRYVWLPIRIQSDGIIIRWHNWWDLSVFGDR